MINESSGNKLTIPTECPLISVVLPIYNRTQYLGKAISSVIEQTYTNWELLLADDGSNIDTTLFINQFTNFPNIKVYRNSKNIGLFPNLNQIFSYCQGTYIILLCSDDYFLPEALCSSLNEIQNNPDALLLIPFTKNIDQNDNPLANTKEYYYNFFTKETRIFTPLESLPLLLKYGSINGNLTGMIFHKNLITEVGGFHQEWKHCADWEWIYRVAKSRAIIISRNPTAMIRVHQNQLSVENGKNLSASLEGGECVKMLLNDPIISTHPNAFSWATHIMQHHLWHAFKLGIKGNWRTAFYLVRAIDRTTGVLPTLWKMMYLLPTRVILKFQNKPFPPPQ